MTAAPPCPALPFYLGCPVWNCAGWVGEVFPPRTPRDKWLSWYTQTFNTVEGNSTFYALPSIESTQRWARQSADGFQFCFKFPREISHDCELENAEGLTETFLRVLQPLADANRLGPTFLQLGPAFGPRKFGALQRYLEGLPKHWKWAVELRHLDWFDQGDNEGRVNDLLSSLAIDKVLFDSRPLYQSPPDDDIEAKSQERKPKTPVRQTVTGKSPMLRIVGRNRVELTDSFFRQWAPIVAKWIRDGMIPYVFTHAPDDANAPALARRFLSILQQELPEYVLTIPRPPMPMQQLTLLDDI
ncbi:DUF72 domain-containing protein [Rubripirellula amarantea]|uniref:DUF72 domain-containing protein n=1 Tax=Rubripirellula amarantea TaxID=2527999 RepID=A0A5C5WS06_9BACT|nr:DUF72 domain-containing protein [Rubripirellula amarantea]MDA8745094.1 DUF72 domain-containing protein [Rubripirellula amarantea]TWT52941.1 hypothetical protein Pla22_05690 [Rubripirellula amarantea]